MAERLGDAEIKITLRTDDAQKQADSLDKDVEETKRKTDDLDKKRREQERTKTLEGRQKGKLKEIGGAIQGIEEFITNKINIVLGIALAAREAGQLLPESLRKELEKRVAAAEGAVIALAAKIDAVNTTLSRTAQITRSQLIFGTPPDLANSVKIVKEEFAIAEAEAKKTKKIQQLTRSQLLETFNKLVR